MQAHLSWLGQAELALSALILLTAFVFLLQNRINSMIKTFTWQSGFLSLATLLQAVSVNQYDLYFSALLTFILKVLFIPLFLSYLVKKLNIRHKVSSIKHPFLLMIGAIALVLFCYHLIIPVKEESGLSTNNILAVAMAVMLLGMLLLITHKKAISHIIGFMSMENGLFFMALIATHGMPMTVELGIAFDVLIATVLFGVFFFHIRTSIDSLDVDKLTLLREDRNE